MPPSRRTKRRGGKIRLPDGRIAASLPPSPVSSDSEEEAPPKPATPEAMPAVKPKKTFAALEKYKDAIGNQGAGRRRRRRSRKHKTHRRRR